MEERELKNRDEPVGIERENVLVKERRARKETGGGNRCSQDQSGTPEKVCPCSTCRCPAANSNTLFRKGTQLNGFCSREASPGAWDCLSRHTGTQHRVFQEVLCFGLAVGGRCRHTRTPSGNSSHPIALSLKRSRCNRPRFESKMSRWVRTGGNTGEGLVQREHPVGVTFTSVACTSHHFPQMPLSRGGMY